MSEPTPRTDALDDEIKTNPPSDSPTPYRASEYESMARLARELERTLAAQRTALLALFAEAERTGSQGIAVRGREILGQNAK